MLVDLLPNQSPNQVIDSIEGCLEHRSVVRMAPHTRGRMVASQVLVEFRIPNERRLA